MDDRMVIACRGIHHWFGPKLVLHDVNLSIARGQIVALVGPSGCGKSTLLRAIVGTHPPRTGEVVVFDQENGRTRERLVLAPGRDRGIVYQRYALFPNLTAVENVAIGPMLDETTIPFRLFKYRAWRALRRRHLDEAGTLLGKLGLGQAQHNYPHELSGGMRQRVAIAQALIMKPAVLLLDEPFGALDEATREDLQRMLLSLYGENLDALKEGRQPPYTIFLVTHELNEAIFVADRILGLSQYWDWRSAGHSVFPGATVVYDEAAPIFSPDDERDFISFREQKNRILESTFGPENLQARGQWTNFWKRVEGGPGHGVVKE